MRHTRILVLLTAVSCALPAAPAMAATFPSRPVTIIVPFRPGGGVDTFTRALARPLSKLWHQPVVVKNAPGATSIIGADKVARAKPDGYTLLLTFDTTVVSNRFIFKHLSYNPDKSLAPVTMIAKSGQVVVANPSFPPNNMRELIALARREPGKIAFGSYGLGSHVNLMFATIAQHEGLHFIALNFKGSSSALRAVMSGEVKVTSASPVTVVGLAKTGKVKALAIGSRHRSNLLPNVPTLAQAGIPYVTSEGWFGLFATGGTSQRLVNRISRDVDSVLRRPAFTKKYLTAFGLNRVADTPRQFAAAIRADVRATAKMVKAAGIKPH